MRRFALLAGSVVCVVVLGALAVYAQWSSAAETNKVHRDDRVVLQSTLAGLVQQYVDFTFLTAKTAADDRTWSLQPDDPADRAALKAVVHSSDLQSYGAAVVSLTGQPLTTYPSSRALPAPSDPGFTPLRTDLLTGQPGLSDVMSVGHQDVVAFAVPIEDAGHPVALLVTFANLRTWPLQIYNAQLRIGTASQSYVLDSHGAVAAATDPTLIGQRLPQLPEQVTGGGTGMTNFSGPGGAAVASYGPAGLGWTAATIQPDATFSGALNRSRHREMLALALLLSIAVLLLIVFHHKRQRALAKLADERLFDPLTGLAQRALFELRLNAALARHRRNRRPLGVLFCDLDDFKGVNDRFGHNTGDQLLVAIADRLSRAVRETDMVVRLGGDEFAVVMEETFPDEARDIGDRIRTEVGAELELSGRTYEPKLSVGGAVLLRTHADLDELLHEADMAMYAAKRRGGGVVITTFTDDPTGVQAGPMVDAERVGPSGAE